MNYLQGSAKGKRHSCVDFFEADAFTDGKFSSKDPLKYTCSHC